MVWEQSYLNPPKLITHVWVGLGKSSCVRIHVTALPPALLSNYEICYHYKILEVMHNLNVLGLKKSLVQMLQQFLPHHTKFSCHIWKIIDTSKSQVLL